MLMNRAENKVAMVTGGSHGIGKSMCLFLAKEGAKVAVTDIFDIEGIILVKEIIALGYIAYYWHLDASDKENVKDVISKVNNKFGKIDILVNNDEISDKANKFTRLLSSKWALP